MKLEIDLEDILRDEYGDSQETLAEAIRRQVVEAYKAQIDKAISRQIKEEVSTYLDNTLKAALDSQIPGICENIIDAEYTPVSAYGSKSPPTSLRAEIAKTIQSQMVYDKTKSAYNPNAFTKAVNEVVASTLNKFKADFDKAVTAEAMAGAVEYVQQRLNKILGGK